MASIHLERSSLRWDSFLSVSNRDTQFDPSFAIDVNHRSVLREYRFDPRPGRHTIQEAARDQRSEIVGAGIEHHNGVIACGETPECSLSHEEDDHPIP
jgi:hypothetical protein